MHKNYERSVNAKPVLLQTFSQWKPDQQKYFLDFCTGAKGVKVLYDGFFKEVMDPDIVPERLENFLSQLLGETVTIKSVLANDSKKPNTSSPVNGAPATLLTCSCGNIKK